MKKIYCFFKCKEFIQLLLLLNLCNVILPAYAQQRGTAIKGIVQTERGEVLVGATVEFRSDSLHSRSLAKTDSSGLFSFSRLTPGIVYHFTITHIGYAPVRKEYVFKPGENASILINLKESSSDLNEVVVVGYGTSKKLDVTGAIDQISGKKIAERPVANVFQGLQGVSPGLNITYKGGQPGATPTINIRGFASINDNSGSPLIIIDGIASTTDDLLRINPIDIATITVLKDAASAAIYGARASFGVILLTTKQGVTAGRQSVSYSNYLATSRKTILPEPVTDPFIYMKVLETSTDNTPWDYVNYTSWQYDWARQRSDDPSSAPDTKVNPDDPSKWAYMGNNNWNDYFFSKNNFSQYHSVSFSGSAITANKRQVGYLLSADYTDENGLNKLAKDDWNRYGFRGKINFAPLSWLKVDNNLNVYQLKRDQPTYNATDVYYLQPTDVAVNPDGTWAGNGAGRLAAQLTDGGRNQQTRFGFQDILRGTGTFLNGDLQITGDASFKRELWKYHSEYLPYQIGYGPNDVRTEGIPSSLTETNGTIKQDVIDLYADYNKSFGEHAIKLLAGYNQESYEWNPVTVSKSNLISSSVPYIGLATGDVTVNTISEGGYYSYAIRSYFGRVNYNYKDRYILEGNGRFDGSSRFPANNRWGFFPSVSGAWIASKEAFWKNILPVVPTFKMRASYGSLGNQSVAYYGYIQTLPVSQSSYLIGGSLPTVLGTAPPLKVDPNNYSWEKVTTTNVGTDIGLLNDKIFASFDYYIRNTSGMLAPSQELPAVLGSNSPSQNAADLSTKGWELSLNYKNSFILSKKTFAYDARITLSDSRSRITKYNNAGQTFSAAYRPGQVIGEIWGLTNDGMFKKQDEINKLDESAIVPWGALQIVSGWPKYKDLDGNGKIERGTSAKDPKDLRIIGNASPRYRFSFNLNVNWNNLDVSLFLQGVAKQDYYPHHYLFWGPFQQPYANIYPWNLDFYRSAAATAAQRATYSKSYIAAGLADANTNSYFPVLQSWLADNNYGAGLDIPQTKYLLSAAYLRVKNLTVGYTFPSSLTKKMGINRFRIFFSGENIFEFSSIKKYVDPEAVSDGFGWEYPYQRKYSFGLNADF